LRFFVGFSQFVVDSLRFIEFSLKVDSFFIKLKNKAKKKSGNNTIDERPLQLSTQITIQY